MRAEGARLAGRRAEVVSSTHAQHQSEPSSPVARSGRVPRDTGPACGWERLRSRLRLIHERWRAWTWLATPCVKAVVTAVEDVHVTCCLDAARRVLLRVGRLSSVTGFHLAASPRIRKLGRMQPTGGNKATAVFGACGLGGGRSRPQLGPAR
ncbi:hypothetical protein PSPO01_07001 [Paraphaeosphaeria sporulosa]